MSALSAHREESPKLTDVPEVSESLIDIDEDIYEEEEEADETCVSHKIIWEQIMDKSEGERKEVDTYIKIKTEECDVPENPEVAYLEDEIFPLLLHIMQKTIYKAKEMECIKHQKSTFNGIDYIAEMLWNMNTRHPERWDNWTYRFDMDWVNEWLKDHPRPYFPFSWIWSKDFAATKIQAGVRAYWVRRRDDVQEMRQFWKALLREKMEQAEGTKELSNTGLVKSIVSIHTEK